MKPVFRSNLFAMIIIINVIIGGILLNILFRFLKLSVGSQLVLQEVILLLTPVIIFFIITKLPIKETLKLLLKLSAPTDTNDIDTKSKLLIQFDTLS